MSSNINKTWREPIAVTPESLKAVETQLVRFGVLGRRAIVAAAGFDPDKVETANDARVENSTLSDWRYDNLAREIESAETITWSVWLSNDIRRSKMTLDQVLSLPNVRDATIKEVEVVVGSSHRHRMEISFTNVYSWSATVKIWGDYNDVHTYSDEIIKLLTVSTRNWSIVTKHWVGAIAIIASVLALCVATVFAIYQIGTARSWTSAIAAQWIVWSVVSLLGVAPWATMPLTQKWKSIFPMVEFKFGGGINAAEARRGWRNAAWMVPFVIIGAPLVVNLLSSAIAG